jgi:hypothetical protein
MVKRAYPPYAHLSLIKQSVKIPKRKFSESKSKSGAPFFLKDHIPSKHTQDSLRYIPSASYHNRLANPVVPI